MHVLRACVERLAAPEPGVRLAALRAKLWPEHQRTLFVRFIGGHKEIHRRIAQVACIWELYAGIEFVFNGHPNAHIRIGFEPGGSWSLVGRDALDRSQVGPTEPTMNFGWLEPGVDDTTLRTVVLHEFGHALGLVHEHQSPQAKIPWNKEAVYRFYAGPPNYWNRQTVDANLFSYYAGKEVRASAFDRESIMLYPIPKELTDGQFEIGWNTDLSPTDRAQIALLYPKVKVR